RHAVAGHFDLVRDLFGADGGDAQHRKSRGHSITTYQFAGGCDWPAGYSCDYFGRAGQPVGFAFDHWRGDFVTRVAAGSVIDGFWPGGNFCGDRPVVATAPAASFTIRIGYSTARRNILDFVLIFAVRLAVRAGRTICCESGSGPDSSLPHCLEEKAARR